MTKRSRVYPALMLGSALWLSVFATACVAPPRPKEALASAQTLVQRAEQEGAGQYAPRPLREAKDKVEKAESEINARDYGDALKLAEQAQVDALLAAAEADRGKTEASVKELSQTIQAMETDLRFQKEDDAVRTPPLSFTAPEVQ